MQKLENVWVRGIALQFFKSNLGNRKLAGILGPSLSSKNKLTCGVPQGTVLGHILFIIYITNLYDMNMDGEVIINADDTAFILKGHHWKDV